MDTSVALAHLFAEDRRPIHARDLAVTARAMGIPLSNFTDAG